MPEDRPDLSTWTQRREAQLEVWIDEHLAGLAKLRCADLRDAAVIRAIATRSAELARLTEHLGALRGDGLREDLLVAAFRLQLADV